MSIDKNDGSLHKGLGTDQLVIGGIVLDIQHTNLAGADLGTPGEVTRVKTEGTVLLVTSASTDLVDALFTNLGHGAWSAHLELSLLAELGATSSRLATLVHAFTCDSLLIGEEDGYKWLAIDLELNTYFGYEQVRKG